MLKVQYVCFYVKRNQHNTLKFRRNRSVRRCVFGMSLLRMYRVTSIYHISNAGGICSKHQKRPEVETNLQLFYSSFFSQTCTFFPFSVGRLNPGLVIRPCIRQRIRATAHFGRTSTTVYLLGIPAAFNRHPTTNTCYYKYLFLVFIDC
jgi:hypothetical protein